MKSYVLHVFNIQLIYCILRVILAADNFVRITGSANLFALRVIRTYKKSHYNHDSIGESIFDCLSKISHEFDISEFERFKFACIWTSVCLMQTENTEGSNLNFL